MNALCFFQSARRILTAVALAALILEVSADDAMKQDFVPDWAKDALWYQIFPVLFRNGDLANDPTKADI
jgi:hypothetical protein